MKLERRLEKINKIRNQGLTPGVIYGKMIESTPIQISNAALADALKTYGRNKTFKVTLDKKNHDVYFKEVQSSILKPSNITHFSLLKVSATDTITADISIQIHGKFEVEKQNLVVQQIMHSLQVEYPVTVSMDKIEIDVSSLQVGEAIYVKDIALPKNCTTAIDPDEMVANVVYPKVIDEPETEEAVDETTDTATEETKSAE